MRERGVRKRVRGKGRGEGGEWRGERGKGKGRTSVGTAEDDEDCEDAKEEVSRGRGWRGSVAKKVRTSNSVLIFIEIVSSTCSERLQER